ncbi:hypothetical protein IID21_05150 [Patescibacteria group bacterium]|nr:hypothetical protein [Patescibacteria group bacterium]
MSKKDDLSLEERIMRDLGPLMEKKLGKLLFDMHDVQMIQNIVPDADISTILFVRNPEPGEGRRVIVVKDKEGIKHRVSLTRH